MLKSLLTSYIGLDQLLLKQIYTESSGALRTGSSCFAQRCLNYPWGGRPQIGSQLYLCKQCGTLECNYTSVPRGRLRLVLVLTTMLGLVLTFSTKA